MGAIAQPRRGAGEKVAGAGLPLRADPPQIGCQSLAARMRGSGYGQMSLSLTD